MVSSHTIKLKRVPILEMKVITISIRIITKTNKTIRILTFLNTVLSFLSATGIQHIWQKKVAFLLYLLSN